MDSSTPAKTLVSLAKTRWRPEHAYRELNAGLRLDHVDARNFTGWHRRATLLGPLAHTT
jgi:SRSO17 transposase